MMKTEISVAMCADKNVEIGLHVTLYSLLKNSERPVKVNLVHKGYSDSDIDRLRGTLHPFVDRYELNLVEFDERPLFSRYKGLHGNQFNFTKLMLAPLLADDRVIYLDTDLVINCDLGELFDRDLHDLALGAAGIETIYSSLRSKFYQSIGMKPEALYFNSGVMLMDLKQWRKTDITSQCLALAEKYVDRVAFGDEAILNCMFYEQFQVLDACYNYQLYPNLEPIHSRSLSGIFHFVGSPKPWDLMGEFIHGNYSLFRSTLKETQFAEYKSYHNISIKQLKRVARLSRSYYRCLSACMISKATPIRLMQSNEISPIASRLDYKKSMV